MNIKHLWNQIIIIDCVALINQFFSLLSRCLLLYQKTSSSLSVISSNLIRNWKSHKIYHHNLGKFIITITMLIVFWWFQWWFIFSNKKYSEIRSDWKKIDCNVNFVENIQIHQICVLMIIGCFIMLCFYHLYSKIFHFNP